MWVLYLVLVSAEEPLTKTFNSELECKIALEQVENQVRKYDGIEDLYCEEDKSEPVEIKM